MRTRSITRIILSSLILLTAGGCLDADGTAPTIDSSPSTTASPPPDTTAPSVTSPTLTTSNVSAASLDLTIPAASDETTSSADLIYEVRISSDTAMTDLSTTLTVGGVISEFSMTAGQTSKTVTVPLVPGISKSINVTVRDAAGNRAVYNEVTGWAIGTATTWDLVGSVGAVSTRVGHRLLVFNNELLVISGLSQLFMPVPEVHGADLTDLWTFTQKNLTLPSGDTEFMKRAMFGAAILNNTIYLAGGNGWSVSEHTSVLKSTDAATWELATANAPFLPRTEFDLVASPTKLFAIAGGKSRPGGGYDILYNDVWSSTDGANWTQVTADAGFDTRQGHSAFYLKGCLWVIGGQTVVSGVGYVDKKDVWKSCNDGVTWTKVTDSASFTKRARIAPIANKKMMCAFGGYANGDYDKKVYCSFDGKIWFTQSTWAAGREEVEFTFSDDGLYLFGGTYLGYPNFIYKITF